MNALFKVALASAVAVGLVAGVLGSQSTVLAKEDDSQAFTIVAGVNAPSNIEVLAFAPQSLQAHRGDSITWINNGFHDIRFASQPAEFITFTEVDGQMIPTFDPAIAFPSIETGSVYQGGEVGSGLPMPGALPFSLVIDLEPGTYSYLCDVHPGMAGVITVVADDVEIPSPIEVALQGAGELGASVNAATATYVAMQAESMTADSHEVIMGSGDTGRATINQFFPFNSVIHAGESVTWTNPEGSVEGHIVGWTPKYGQDVMPIEVEGQLPILAVGPALLPMTPSESTITEGQEFSSGMVMPGQSYTLTFSEPGVYSYTCHIHPGMSGTIVVLPAA